MRGNEKSEGGWLAGTNQRGGGGDLEAAGEADPEAGLPGDERGEAVHVHRSLVDDGGRGVPKERGRWGREEGGSGLGRVQWYRSYAGVMVRVSCPPLQDFPRIRCVHISA